MKKNILALALTLVFGTVLANPIDGEKKEVKTDASTVTWKAYKVTGSHTGTIALKSGALMFEEGKLNGGEFTVDMTTINTIAVIDTQKIHVNRAIGQISLGRELPHTGRLL